MGVTNPMSSGANGGGGAGYQIPTDPNARSMNGTGNYTSTNIVNQTNNPLNDAELKARLAAATAPPGTTNPNDYLAAQQYGNEVKTGGATNGGADINEYFLGGNAGYAGQQTTRLQAAGQTDHGANYGAIDPFLVGLGGGAGGAGQAGQAAYNLAMSGGAGTGAQGAAGNALMNLGRTPQGPSASVLAMQNANAQALQSNQALAASARGSNTGLALQAASANQGNINTALTQQVGQQRAAEDLAYRSQQASDFAQAGQIYGNQSQQQGSLLGTGASAFGTSASAYGQGAGQVSSNLNNNATLNANTNLGYETLASNVAQQGSSDTAAYDAARQHAFLAHQGLEAAATQNANNRTDTYLAAGLSAAGGALGSLAGPAGTVAGGAGGAALGKTLSDVRAKKDIAPASGRVADAFRTADRDAAFVRSAPVAYPDAFMSGASTFPKPGYMPMVTRDDLHLDPGIAPRVPDGAARPFAPGEYLRNPDGSWSSEVTQSLQNPQLNGGRATNVPSMWLKNGRPYIASGEDESAALARASGLPFQPYRSIQDADKASVARESAWQPIQNPSDARSIPSLWAPPASPGSFPEAPPYSYQYKDPNQPGAEPGMQYGPMAQDLEQTPAGASVVGTDKKGKKFVDPGRLSMLTASEVSQHRKELDALNSRLDAMAASRATYPQTAPVDSFMVQ